MRSYFKISLLFCFLIISTPLLAVVKSNLNDSVLVKRERVFKGEALYGFMNGGSELYLEYSFRELKAIDLNYKGEEYTVEIYKMESPEDAFGIYSVHTFGALFKDTLFRYSCHSSMQLQTCIGDTYYSVVFEKPSDSINYNAVELINYYSDAQKRSAYIDFPEEVRESVKRVSGNLKYMKGPLGMFAASPELTDYFKNIADYKLWTLREENSSLSKAFFYSNNKESIARLKSSLADLDSFFEGEGFVLFEF